MASLSPELITEIGGFPITNTIIATVIVDILLIVFLYFAAKKISLLPGKFQNAVESVLTYFYDLAKSMAGTRAVTIFPWVMTFFIFIVVSNFLGLLPGIGSIGIYETPKEQVLTGSREDAVTKELTKGNEHNDETSTITLNKTEKASNHKEEATQHTEKHLISLVRPATSDFNATLALAAISLLATHILSIRFTGIKNYLSRYFVINPIMLFVGLLELVSEFIKIFSLSFRLFGNIYAGEVVLATISGLFAFLAPLPFLLLESIVAIVQALVFAILTMVFMSMLTEKHHAAGH
ncbi:MAG: F0F1 ATP synthase subunit A [Candidatus Levybacteria bacterium]|nr:F0F1 ATP synthase subunit A [Candidatus Levybacteria bacterium]